MTNISIEDITTGVVDGTGVFDQLMKAVTAHLDKQYNLGRIKGAEYANVYLGSVQSVIAESVQFALQEGIIEKQIDAATKDIELKDIQIKSAEVQKNTLERQLALAEMSIDKLGTEIEIMNQSKIGRSQ